MAAGRHRLMITEAARPKKVMPPPKPRLYIDVDDTIMGKYFPFTFLELRPGIMAQLRILAKLFHVYWLTCWPWENESGMDIQTLLRVNYGHDLVRDTQPMRWTYDHPARKAHAILEPTLPQDWWWLEDRLEHGEWKAIEAAGKADRYIEVKALGPWAFADACLELFKRAGIGHQELLRAGGSFKFFRKEDFLTL